MTRAFRAAMMAMAALMLVPASSLAADVAVLGNNATDDVLNQQAGIVATLVTDAQVAQDGFLNDFDAFIFTRPGGAFNATLSNAAAERVRAFTKRAVLLQRRLRRRRR
jgi:hypothetical protein